MGHTSSILPLAASALALLALCGAEARAHAQEPEDSAQTEPAESAELTEPTESPEPARRPRTRALPDYDGRSPSPPTPGERLLWAPRVVFWPVHIVTEYLLRVPLSWAVSRAEESELPARIVDLFRFGARDQILLAPTFALDLGQRSRVGLHFRYSDLLAEGHSLSSSFSFGGVNVISFGLTSTYTAPTERWSFELSGGVNKRPDHVFYGIGREASQQARVNYGEVLYEVRGVYRAELPRQSSLRVAAGYASHEFVRGNTRVTIDDLVDQGIIAALPASFPEGYEALSVQADLILDSRPDRPAPGTGVRFHGLVSAAVDPGDSNAWLRYGASLGAYVDVTGAQHVLSATLSVHMANALSGSVPFTELPVLSGSGPMSGFVDRLLVGQSAAALALEYSWPIWVYADAKLHAALGNVFGHHFEGFDLPDLRLSVGGGIAVVTSRLSRFEILVGFGTDTLDRGANVESARVMVGVTRDL